MHRRALAIVLAAALSVSACSTSGDDDTTDSTTTAVGTDTTAATGGDDTTTTSEASVEDLDQRMADAVDATLGARRFSAQSLADFEAGTDKVRLELDASVDYEALIADADLSVSAPTGDQALTVLSDGTKLWLQADLPGVAVPGGKTWLEGPSTLLNDSNFEPIGLLGTIVLLRASQDTTVETAVEEIDGVETTVLHTTMTYDEAVDAAGDEAEDFKTSFSLTYAQPVALDVTAWLDADNIVRRLVVEIDPEDETPLGGSYELDLSVPDEIDAPDAPPADDVASGPEADSLLEQLLTR